MSESHPDDAEQLVGAALATWSQIRKSATAVERSGVVQHRFDDAFAFLEISHIKVLLGSHAAALLGTSQVRPSLLLLLDEVAQLRHANAHSPPIDLSADDCALGLSRIARLLREFDLEAAADEVAELRPSLVPGLPGEVDNALWSEFGALRADQVDLLDDAVWPRHETTLLNDVPLCPYVTRHVDHDLDRRCNSAAQEHVRSWNDRVIVIVGVTKSGKTRSLVEAIRKSGLADRNLVWLVKPTGHRSGPLSQLCQAVLRNPGTARKLLIVIDDLQFHLGASREAIAFHDIRRLAEAGTAIAITAHPHVLKGFASDPPTTDRPSGEPTSAAVIDLRLADLLQHRKIEMTPRLDLEEIEAAREITGLEEQVVVRLPESLVAARLVEGKVRAADRVEHAVLQAARLLSLASPDGIERAALVELAKVWASHECDLAPTDRDLHIVLEWAAEPIVGRIAILDDLNAAEDDGASRFRLLDQLREPVPLRGWLTEARLPVVDKLAIALRMLDNGFDETAADLLLADIESASEEPAGVAYLRACAVSDPELQSAHLQRAAVGGNRDAMYELAGRIADDDGDSEIVRYWYEEAAAAGVPEARIELAYYLLRLGRPSDGHTVLQAEAERGNSLAFVVWAEELARMGDLRSARRWFSRAREVGDARAVDHHREAHLAIRLGQHNEAARLFERGHEQGDPWCSLALALLRLAGIGGFDDEVRQLLEAAMGSDDTPPAAGHLVALEHFDRKPSLASAEALASACETTEMYEDSSGFADFDTFVNSDALARAVEQMAKHGWSGPGLRLLYFTAEWTDADVDGMRTPGPDAFALLPAQYYDAYIRLYDERWLYAAADAGHRPAERELEALYGHEDEFEDL